MSLRKDFRITERLGFQLGLNACNWFKHANYGSPYPTTLANFSTCSQAYVLIPCERDHAGETSCEEGVEDTTAIQNNPAPVTPNPTGPMGVGLTLREIAAQIRARFGRNRGLGPWNAIGGSSFWSNTAIVITWDDWGGWYDHVPPPQVIDDGTSWRSGYVYGFRVPLIVISPMPKQGTSLTLRTTSEAF